MIHKRIKLYENREDVILTTYVLDDSPEMLNKKKRPAVLICPGGAYLYCSDREAEPIAMAFATMGYHAFVLNYSVGEQAKYPAPIMEVAMAMLLIREHSDSWLVDEERIALCGFSAGAHNCALYGVKWHQPELAELLHTQSSMLRPAAVIVGYLLNDLRKVEENSITNIQGEMLLKYRKAYFGTEEPTEAQQDAACPSMQVSELTPPMFLWGTSEDNVVPIDNSLTMAQALAKEKVPFELHIFESGDHGFALATQATAGNRSQMDDCAATWIFDASKWLEKHMPLPVDR